VATTTRCFAVFIHLTQYWNFPYLIYRLPLCPGVVRYLKLEPQ